MKPFVALSIILTYAVMSVVTYAVYKHDKTAARTKAWRVPERVLHTCEFLGGWPGALLAQQMLRHKTKKPSYQIVFWLIVIVHAAFWADALICKRFATFFIWLAPYRTH